MAIGVPGWPELAACTASMDRVRMVLMASRSSGDLSLDTVRPVVTVMSGAPSREEEEGPVGSVLPPLGVSGGRVDGKQNPRRPENGRRAPVKRSSAGGAGAG